MLKDHRPPHIYLDNRIYFVTSRTYKEICYFNSNKKKEIFVEILSNLQKRRKISIYAWVLLDNHCHLLLKFNNQDNSLTAVNPQDTKVELRNSTRKGAASKDILPRFVNSLHSITALKLNKLNNTSNRKIWYQYWDYCIRNKTDFFKHFNYIHNNPIKHSKVEDIERLEQYKYSSFNLWIKKKNREFINDCFSKYPILDFSVEFNKKG